jgi:hypothetical protein
VRAPLRISASRRTFCSLMLFVSQLLNSGCLLLDRVDQFVNGDITRIGHRIPLVGRAPPRTDTSVLRNTY